MGNAVPPRMCRSKEAVVASGARRPRPKDAAAPDAAAPSRASVTLMPRNKQRGNDDDDEEETTRHQGCRRRARAVSWVGGEDNACGKAASTTRATVATVKIVLKRKDAEALVARLNAQTARERKARMVELKGELRTGECGGGASPASCRDAWRPRLATVKEN